MVAAFPPISLGALGLVAPMPWLFALRRVDRLIHAAGIGFLVGFLFFGVTLRWVLVIGAVAWLPLTIWLAATMAVASGAIWAFRLWPATRWWLITTGIIVLWGAGPPRRSRLAGFRGGILGYAVGSAPGFIGAVQWIGAQRMDGSRCGIPPPERSCCWRTAITGGCSSTQWSSRCYSPLPVACSHRAPTAMSFGSPSSRETRRVPVPVVRTKTSGSTCLISS